MNKIGRLLEHWIEHCKEHNEKYLEWAERIKEENPDVAELIFEAVRRFEEGVKLLEKAREKL